MTNTDPLPDPESPEWPIAWAAKEVLRRHLGPKFDRRPVGVPGRGDHRTHAPNAVAHHQTAAGAASLHA
jgi:hypothetical protein